MKLIKYQIKEVRKLKPYLLKFFQDNQLKSSKLLEIEEIKKECNSIISFNFVNQISTKEEDSIYSSKLQIIEITLKKQDLPISTLRGYYNLTKIQNFFILKNNDNCIRYFFPIKAFTQQSIFIDKVVDTDWINLDSLNEDNEYIDQNVTSILDLIQNILFKIYDYRFRKHESINKYFERVEQIKDLKRKISTLENKMNNESQSKKKLKFYNEIDILKSQLSDLEKI
ncbi:MAG: DUF4391 domain-containing protein [Malacoplasma sp.]|nr:DUF4391 domain-containing protein [Malacoplasma sp.]